MNMAVDEGANAGQYIKIAFIDWGIDYWKDGEEKIHYHPDLEDNVAGGRGFKSLDGYVYELEDHKDPNGHGTLVAGIIAAVDNDNGVIGTAPKAEIYALKLFMWSPEEVREAIYWAIGHGALIISISLTLDDDYDDVREACDDAYDTYDRLLIAASGNKNGPVDYPAAYDSVIAVGAVDENGQRWVNPSKPEIGRILVLSWSLWRLASTYTRRT